MAWFLDAALLLVTLLLVAAAGTLRRERDEAIEALQAVEADLSALRSATASTGERGAGPAEAEGGTMEAVQPAETDAVVTANEQAEAETMAAQPAETDAVVTADEAEAKAETMAAVQPVQPAETRLVALWALAQLDQQRTWRLSLASGDEDGPGDGLAGALAMEVDRIREDVGTPGELAYRLEAPIAAHDAALALLGARVLLAVLVPHTQAYDIAVDQRGSTLALAVACTGWEGPSEAADDVSRLLAAVAPAGGELSVDTDDAGRLLATLQLPLMG